MILTRVMLDDYGVYRGTNEFDFTSTRQTPIVLVGGTNGAGKTTLFESIMLCLYGMSSMTKRGTKKSYEQFLERKIHRRAGDRTRANHASVTVQFRFFHNGRETEYRVERSWEREEGSIIEQLDVKKRGAGEAKFGKLDIVEQSHWQSFIEDIIPKGIIKLFFFDGEKIVEIARDGTEDVAIRESFKSLLGIELVEQLRTDLRVNMTRNLTGNDKSLQQYFEKYKAEKDDTVRQDGRLKERNAQKQTELDSIQKEIETLEGGISKIGGRFADGRDKNKKMLFEQKMAYEGIRQNIMELCAGVLPFALIPSRLERLEQQIRGDEAIQQKRMGQKLLRSKISGIKSTIKTKRFWRGTGLDSTRIDKVVRTFSELLDAQADAPISAKKPFFDFSAGQASRITDTIRRANTTALDDLKKHTKKIVTTSTLIGQLESSVANAPKDDEIGALVSKVGDLRSQEGMLRAEMDHIEEKMASNTALRTHLDSKLRDVISQIYKTKKSQQHVELTRNVQKVLDEFVEHLKVKKIGLLERYLLDAMGVLMHKRRLVESVKVDPGTFEVTLYAKGGGTLPKDLLSEGEKQMFAMSILWALAKTSGRPLPFVIDTPLARLDAAHRTNIVERFLPAASHQILVFSTDKEIEREDYQKLKPYLAKSYAMEYDEDSGATTRRDGYFWDKRGEKVVTV